MKLRLLLFPDCFKNCEWCCNNDYDLNKLESTMNYKGYDEILLTGGEPMLKPKLVKQVIRDIREQNSEAKIYMYTAMPIGNDIYEILRMLDGITITIHDQEDMEMLEIFDQTASTSLLEGRSVRLNIFKGIEYNEDYYKTFYQVKDNIEWMKNCPLPQDEVFKRLAWD